MTASKFRVWDGEQMHHPSENNLKALVFSHRVEVWGEWHLISDTTTKTGWITIAEEAQEETALMHYTGLDDAEGTPIYESDVVEYDLRRGTCLQGGEVIFRAGSFMIERTDGIYVRLNKIVASPSHHLTVLGNTFQTPALLD